MLFGKLNANNSKKLSFFCTVCIKNKKIKLIKQRNALIICKKCKYLFNLTK